MNLGIKLRKLRHEKNISQMDVAIAINIDQSTYSRIESDKLEPKANQLVSISKYFGKEINYFFD
jgi:transcriptional regulator with XRE-family HTH domain